MDAVLQIKTQNQWITDPVHNVTQKLQPNDVLTRLPYNNYARSSSSIFTFLFVVLVENTQALEAADYLQRFLCILCSENFCSTNVHMLQASVNAQQLKYISSCFCTGTRYHNSQCIQSCSAFHNLKLSFASRPQNGVRWTLIIIAQPSWITQ